MQLITAIHNAGYKGSGLYKEFAEKHAISYQKFSLYTRCNNSRCHDPEIWKWIKEFLEKKKIDWIEG